MFVIRLSTSRFGFNRVDVVMNLMLTSMALKFGFWW